MQTCSTCRHWVPYTSAAVLIACKGRGRCTAVTQTETDPALLALVLSAEEADFVTSPDFGCVMHEASAEAVQEDDGA